MSKINQRKLQRKVIDSIEESQLSQDKFNIGKVLNKGIIIEYYNNEDGLQNIEEGQTAKQLADHSGNVKAVYDS